MDLILWRHAEAEDAVPDISRRLTSKGERQARQMARWLREYLPDDARILVSPAVRTQQTAQALELPFETHADVGLMTSADALIRLIGWPESDGAVLVVGHQPTLGQVASRLLCGQELDWSVKKGAIWWLSHRVRGGHPQTVLRACLTADIADGG